MANEHDYPRSEEVRTLGEATASLVGGDHLDLDFGQYSEEWWKAKDLAVADARARDAVAQERERQTKRAGELLDNGFPERCLEVALKASHANAIDTQAMKHARVFLHLPKRVLVLAGGVGCGKTTAATWIALAGDDPRPGFLRTSELERRGRYDRKLNEWLREKTSLVVDDIGSEVLDGKGVFRSLLDEVVDSFYGDRKRLVITTNLRARKKQQDEEDQFIERYGERVWSRLQQVGEWGDCGVKDLRKEQP